MTAAHALPTRSTGACATAQRAASRRGLVDRYEKSFAEK
jgi:hypothetical protein